ncbi:MAG: TRAP transporter permease [Treponemataceae bacterium]
MTDEEKRRFMAEFDPDSSHRHFIGVRKKIMRYLLVGFSLFALWLNTFAVLPEQIRRSLFIGFAVFLSYLLFPAKKSLSYTNSVPWYDVLLGLVGALSFGYMVFNFRSLVDSASSGYSSLDITVGIIGIVLLMEVCRRVVGIPILAVVTAFLMYAKFGNYVSGSFGHRGFSIKRIVEHLFYNTEGVIGTPLGVCSTFIVLFIIFGSFIDKTGVGKFFIQIANSLAGKSIGGPAKVAVIASALQGMISGSSVANTVGSGSFTIPMMKKTGYKPEFAAAVEAVSSTGGQIMPPIMGAAAFLMAEMTGIAYSRIVIAAILPAALYFAGIWLMIHFEAKKLGLKGLDASEVPNFFKLMITDGYLLLPLVALVVFLMNGYTPSRSAVIAILISIIVSLFKKEHRISGKGFFDALENGARSTLGVAIACSVAGMIVGVVTLTGLGLKLATNLLALSGGVPLIALFFTMIASIVLGMGVPTTANYVIMATITAPIVIKMGVPLLPAHMFVFYFGIVADITPPVALAAYAGSAIAKSDPLKTGLTATRLAITAFIIPYIFALNPALLFIDTVWYHVIVISFTALVGMIGISSAMEGYMFTKMPIWERLICFPAGLLLIIPSVYTDIAGVFLVLIILATQYFSVKRGLVT